MKKYKICLGILATSFLFLIGTACKNETEKVEISGVKNIECSYKVTEYDLLAGITSSNGEDVILSGEVAFGTPGEYPISYTCGKTTVNAVVKIYGEPQVKISNDITVAYENIHNGDILLVFKNAPMLLVFFSIIKTVCVKTDCLCF